jgi:6-pyruvoyl-tetrahydropterin synthase
MFSVEVRDRIMIAHSLPDPFFGPAQNKHGATFVVDVAFFREAMTPENVVVDIGAALDVLSKTLKPLAYQDLDTLPQFKGVLTTTEYLCKYIFDAMVTAARSGALGKEAAGLAKIRVTLHETDLARAAYEGALG